MIKMYRIYDKVLKKWIKDNIYLAPNGDIVLSEKTLFGKYKLRLGLDTRYIVHKSVGMTDRNNVDIFEGDICRISKANAIGVVTYVTDYGSYFIMDNKYWKYFPIEEKHCDQIEIIGNVFDNNDLIVEV